MCNDYYTHQISSVFIEATTSQDLLRFAPSSIGVAFSLLNIGDFEGIVYKPQSVCVDLNGDLRGQVLKFAIKVSAKVNRLSKVPMDYMVLCDYCLAAVVGF